MESNNNKPHIDPQFHEVWDAAGQYKYSFENGNDDAWKKFSADLANKKASPAVSSVQLRTATNIWSCTEARASCNEVADAEAISVEVALCSLTANCVRFGVEYCVLAICSTPATV